MDRIGFTAATFTFVMTIFLFLMITDQWGTIVSAISLIDRLQGVNNVRQV